MFRNSNKKDAAEACENSPAKARKEAAVLIFEMLNDAPKMSPEQREELKTLMRASGISDSSLHIAQAIKKADDFGDRLHEQTLALIEQAHEVHRAAQEHPDPEDLLKALKRLRDMPAEKKRQDTWQQQGCPVTADIKVGKPLKLKPLRLKA